MPALYISYKLITLRAGGVGRKTPKLIYSYLNYLNVLIHGCKIKIILRATFV